MTAPRATFAAICLASGLALAACAGNRTLVVVLPESDGHVGAVVVHDRGPPVVLHGAYAADRTAGRGGRITTLTPAEVRGRFGAALDGLPRAPADFTFHFALDSTDLAPEEMATLDAVIAEIARRPVAEVVITGHTDRLGDDTVNDALSLARALAVRDRLAPLLASHGVAGDSLTVAGRGKREPLPGHERDGVTDAVNRRVVITVR